MRKSERSWRAAVIYIIYCGFENISIIISDEAPYVQPGRAAGSIIAAAEIMKREMKP